MQYQNELSSIIEAIKIISPDSFSFAGKIHNSNTNMSYPYQGTITTDPLVRSLTDVLYQQFYCRKFTGTYYEQVPVAEDNAIFQEALCNANSTIEKWDKDWTIEQILPTGQYVAYKNGKYKFVYPGEFITTNHEGLLPKAGTRIVLHCFKESRTVQSGFYFVFSNEIYDNQDLSMLVRFYWNIKNTGAAKLIKLLTQNLNKYKIPFSFKCVNNPSFFTRSDSGVLYLAKPDFHITAQVLVSIYNEIKDELNDEVPIFTKKLNCGLSLAEDPATGESFGMSRCGIIAEGIKNAYQNGKFTNEKIMHEIQHSFEARRIQIDMPYLNAGSKDIYEFPLS